MLARISGNIRRIAFKNDLDLAGHDAENGASWILHHRQVPSIKRLYRALCARFKDDVTRLLVVLGTEPGLIVFFRNRLKGRPSG